MAKKPFETNKLFVSTDDQKIIKLHFQRFEFKYLIDLETVQKIKNYIFPYVITDQYAVGTQNLCYEVVSLYYDNPLYYYYYEKMDGVKNRKKIRLRTYRNDDRWAGNIFFEIKRKNDAVVLKDRICLSREDYRYFLSDDSLPTVGETSRKIIEEYQQEKKMRAITPRLLVTYDREPYLGRFSPNFRVTFDSRIRAMENDDLYSLQGGWREIYEGLTVMEIKFTGLLPSYIRDVIQKFDLERTAFSKYCHGVECCGSVMGVLPTSLPAYYLRSDLMQLNELI